MHCPRKISAFTMMELLVVLAIVSGALIFTTSFTARIRQTFVAQQYVKTILQQSRIARRKSMLITRNSNDNGWVHGIGLQLTQTQGSWQLTLIKALEREQQSFFYRAYPKSLDQLDFEEVDDSLRHYLPEGVTLDIMGENLISTKASLEKRCLDEATGLRIVFESINGKLHIYCRSMYQGVYIEIGENDQIPFGEAAALVIGMKYTNGAIYQDRVIISTNGDISIAPYEGGKRIILPTEEPEEEEEEEEPTETPTPTTENYNPADKLVRVPTNS